MNIILDACLELLNYVVSFVKPIFSGATGRTATTRNYGNFHVGNYSNIQVVNNAQEWQMKVNEARGTGKVILAKFFATWCGHCKKIAPFFVELSNMKDHRQLVFVQIDVDEASDVANEYNVESMPTFIFIRDGQEIDKISGSDKSGLERKCYQYGSRR